MRIEGREHLVLDRDWLLDRYEGDQGLVQELYLIFTQDAPPRLQALDPALRSAAGEEVVSVVHGLKNMAGAAGAWKLMGLSAQAEKEARSGRLDQVAAMVPALTSAMDEVLAAIGPAL